MSEAMTTSTMQSPEPELEIHSIESFSAESEELKLPYTNHETFIPLFPPDDLPLTMNSRTSSLMKELLPKDDIDVDSTFLWSDDDDDSAFRSLGVSLHDSIVAIQQEELKIDAFFADDKSSELRSEISELRREINDRDGEIEEMKSLLTLKENRIGVLELERDLYKADAAKLSNDLFNCVARIQKMKEENKKRLEAAEENEKQRLEAEEQTIEEHSVPRPTRTQSTESTSVSTDADSSRSSGYDSSRISRRLDPPSCSETSRQQSESSLTITTASRSIPPLHPQYSLMEEKPNNDAPLRSRRNKVSSRKAKRLIFPFCRTSSQKEKRTPSKNQDEQEDVEIKGEIMDQVQDMSQRMKCAIETSEELRCRLAMLSRYYEKKIRHLEKNKVDLSAYQEDDYVGEIEEMHFYEEDDNKSI